MSNATNVERKISMDACEQYIVEVLQILHRTFSRTYGRINSDNIKSCESQSVTGNKTWTVSNFWKLFSSIMCWQ